MFFDWLIARVSKTPHKNNNYYQTKYKDITFSCTYLVKVSKYAELFQWVLLSLN
jgi:hypothetical protein